MPRQDSKSTLGILDMRLFEPSVLRDAFSFETTLHHVAHCVRSATIDSAVELMLTRPHLVEFVWSASDEETSKGLTEWILNGFPTSPDVFVNSLAYRLLDLLSLSLLFVTYPSQSDIPDDLTNLRRDVELTFPVLQALISVMSTEDDSVDFPDEQSNYNAKAKKSQRQRKSAKRAGRGSTIDSKPFNDLKIAIPTSSTEARALATDLLLQQKQILEIYLSILRRPELTETFTILYIPEEVDAVGASVSDDVRATEVNGVTVGTEVPSAYPMVQPMKAALYFDSAEGFGEWRILMSTKAEKNLREARNQDGNMFKIIIKKIKELSNGHFSEDNQKRLTGPSTEVPIFEAKMTRDTRLIYQVDCVPEYDSEVERQVIRIFGIYTHAQLDGRFWDSMGHQLSRKGKEYRARCAFRNKPHHSGDNVIMPASFPGHPEDAPLENQPFLELRKEDLEELHSLLVLEKFVTFSQALLNSILADHDVAHVFNVSPQEKRIIEHTSSCYVLGRSGTGKTTTMLFKMLGIERYSQLLPDLITKPRQLFVTQSRVLAGKVEGYFSRLIESLVTASYSAQELERFADNRNKQEWLIDLDDEEDWRSDLPKKFSLLEDEHFPMFITFDRLCALLEADIDTCSGPPAFVTSCQSEDCVVSPTSPTVLVTPISLRSDSANRFGESSSNYTKRRRASFVPYGTFLESYWNHFPEYLTKGLDSSLVFSEFIGVIKGSELTLDRPGGFLDRAAYESLSHRSQATFATQRDDIYSLFLAYLKRKRARGDYDAADRTHAIVKYMRENGMVFGKKIDFLYVDEVQDNLLVDSLLLRSICRNPNGLFWAGDTAQTISVGSAFKFTDLKAFQHRVEEQMTDRHQLSTTPPHEFQLTVNYRSHGGIVNCAHSVVELITKFWPYSIDEMAPERGIVNGSKPIFFTGWDQDAAQYQKFLFGSAESQVEFGAQQCILVRHDAARNKLREQVGDIGLIMTLYESKGLEFNDVLLYNFFEDSTADLSQWRVVLNAIEKSEKDRIAAPRFEENRHAVICSELKCLYVAITRSRKNLWVVDRSKKGDPMRIYWTSRDQIKKYDPSSQVPHPAVSSSPEEWMKTGETLFRNKRYSQALHAFERARRPREAAVCHAYIFRETARLVPKSTRPGNTERPKAFLKAAEAFNECAANAEAKQDRQRRAWYRTAAECFLSAGEEGRAAEAYVKASEYTLGARYYRKAGMFDQVVEVIQVHENEIEPGVADRLMDVAKIFFFKKNKLDKALKLFTSNEHALNFMGDYDLDVAHATVLEKMRRTTEAADRHLSEGRTLEAIQVLHKNLGNEDVSLRASQCLLEGFWQNLSFGISFDKSNVVHKQLLEYSSNLDTSKLPQSKREEIVMFQSIASGDVKKLHALGVRFYSVTNNLPAALLCLDHVFSTPPRIKGIQHVEVASELRLYLAYIRLLRDVWSHQDPGNNKGFQKLFCFRLTEDHLVHIPKATFLYQHIDPGKEDCVRSDETGSVLGRSSFQKIVSRVLIQRMRDRVKEEDNICRATKGFSPCLYFVSSGKCNRDDCPHAHIGSKDLTIQWFNTRIRLFLLQFLILQYLFESDHRFPYNNLRFWLGMLYEALNPPIHKLGSRQNLDLAYIPEARQGIQAVRDMNRNLCNHLSPYPFQGYDPEFLTTVVRVGILTFEFDKHGASFYLYNANFIRSAGLRYLPLLSERGYVVNNFIASLQGDARWSILAGVHFMKFILGKKIPINIEALCDVMDRLCGSIVIAHRFQYQASLHNVMLPRTWLLHLFGRFSQLRNEETKLEVLGMFLAPMQDLLAYIDMESSEGPVAHLTLQGWNISEFGSFIRNMYTSRICRCLCLLGDNIKDDKLRASILRIVNSFLKQGRVTPPAYRPYARARNWGDLATAVRNSTTGSLLDEMIILLDVKKQIGPVRQFKSTRSVVYEKVDDIERFLTFRSGVAVTPLHAKVTKLAPVIIPQEAPMQNPIAEKEYHEAKEGILPSSEKAQEGGLEEVAKLGEVALGIEPAREQKIFSDGQIAAAKVIQGKYRRIHSERQANSPRGLSADRIRLWHACEVESRNMKWPFRRYRLLFRGPLAHILLCLEGLLSYGYLSKKAIKKKFIVEQHLGWEVAMDHLTNISTFLRKALKLQKALEPSSELHRRRDLMELKARVLEVEELMKELPPENQQEYAEDLYLGLTAMARQREAVKRKKAKPELVVEDRPII